MMGPLGTRVTDRKGLKSRHRIYVVLRDVRDDGGGCVMKED